MLLRPVNNELGEKMSRKTETWINEDFPHPEKWLKLLEGSSDRDVAVMLCSIIDSLLADLISLRLEGDNKEIETFLGLDGDGRAPLGSLGARIQAAYLLGLIEKFQLKNLRHFKDIRNLFSHNVLVSFDDERVVNKIKAVIDNFKQVEMFRGIKADEEMRKQFKKMIDETGFSRDVCKAYFITEATMQIALLQYDIAMIKEYDEEVGADT